MKLKDIEEALQQIVANKRDETISLFMVRGEYDAVKSFIEDFDKRMREQCACIKDR